MLIVITIFHLIIFFATLMALLLFSLPLNISPAAFDYARHDAFAALPSDYAAILLRFVRFCRHTTMMI